MRRNIRICPHTTKRAFAISRDAAALGFDWPTAADVVDKLQEEVDEIRDALAKPQYDGHLADEIGDLFFGSEAVVIDSGVSCAIAFQQNFRKRGGVRGINIDCSDTYHDNSSNSHA